MPRAVPILQDTSPFSDEMPSNLEPGEPDQASSKTNRCYFLELPAELLLSIAEYMSPANQFLASFTCKALYSTLRPGAADEARKLPVCQHDEFLAAMLDDLSIHDKIVCAACHRLHSVQEHDVPGVTKGLTFNGCWPAGAKVGNMSKYCLHQRHVQLALRYSRAGVRKERLDRLLQPYRDCGSATFSPMFRETAARPVIAAGHYLLHVHEAFRPLYHSEITMGQCQFLELCPHTGISPRFSDYRSHWQLRQGLAQAIDQRGSRFDGWCLDCPTDFSVVVTDAGLEVDAWYDFGSDPGPSSEYWVSHVDVVDHELLRRHLMFPENRMLRLRYEQAMALA